MNRTAQDRSRDELVARLMTALRIYTPARYCCRFDQDSFFETFYQPQVAAKVIGLAFLDAVTAWEDFVERAFLDYLSGYVAKTGYAPKLRTGRAMNRTHAAQVLTGEANAKQAERRCRWNSFRWVLSVASIHFHSSNPFADTSPDVVRYLEHATIIRNRVAHNSDRSRNNFRMTANALRGKTAESKLRRGYSPGWLLAELSEDSFPSREGDYFAWQWYDNFESFISLWIQEADRIVPVT